MICPGFRVHINVNLLFFISKPAIMNLFSRIPNSISEFHVRTPYQNSRSDRNSMSEFQVRSQFAYKSLPALSGTYSPSWSPDYRPAGPPSVPHIHQNHHTQCASSSCKPLSSRCCSTPRGSSRIMPVLISFCHFNI